MSIKYRMHQHRPLMHICITETIDQSELRNFSAQIAQTRDHNGSFDLIVELSWQEEEAAGPVLSHFAPPAESARLAAIAPGDLAFGTARQFQGLYGLSHANFAVFRSVLEAFHLSGIGDEPAHWRDWVLPFEEKASELAREEPGGEDAKIVSDRERLFCGCLRISFPGDRLNQDRP